MKLQTSRFGEIDISDDSIIQFPEGIPGFEELQQFALITVEEHGPLEYIQSVEDGELAFIVIDPFLCFPDYDIQLPEQAVEQLSLAGSEDILIRTTVSIRGDIETATTNLVAPIIINRSSRIGKQVILTATDYTTQTRIFPV
jgi:flagellar assembly factor FliW